MASTQKHGGASPLPWLAGYRIDTSASEIEFTPQIPDRRREIPVNFEKIPVPSSRDFGLQDTENAGKIRPENRR
jgi:hypothetical protein